MGKLASARQSSMRARVPSVDPSSTTTHSKSWKDCSRSDWYTRPRVCARLNVGVTTENRWRQPTIPDKSSKWWVCRHDSHKEKPRTEGPWFSLMPNCMETKRSGALDLFQHFEHALGGAHEKALECFAKAAAL